MHSLAVWCGHRRLETSEHRLSYCLVVIGPCWMNGSYRLPIDIDSVHVWSINDRWAIATAVARSRRAVAFVIRLAENHSVDVQSSSWYICVCFRYLCFFLFGQRSSYTSKFRRMCLNCFSQIEKPKTLKWISLAFLSSARKTSMLTCFTLRFFSHNFSKVSFFLYWFFHTSQFIRFLFCSITLLVSLICEREHLNT